MKILNPGRKVGRTIYRGTCKHCGCVVECEPNEIQSTGFSKGWDQRPTPWSKKERTPDGWVRCPNKTCGAHIDVYRGESLEVPTQPKVKPSLGKKADTTGRWNVTEFERL